MNTNEAIDKILQFWFVDHGPKEWFAKDLSFDQKIKEQFSVLHHKASEGELYLFRDTPKGRVAEIILLDQFSRNIYRDTPGAFRWDQMALVLAQEAIGLKMDQSLEVEKRKFLYMPFMHSESQGIHVWAVKLFEALGDEKTLDFELKHKKIIDRFGRYPHRNAILGRSSTPEEKEFLKEEGSSF